MGCGCACSTNALTDGQSKVLVAMENFGKPCTSKDIAGSTGLDSKMISKDIAVLKKQGYIDSPVRCKYGVTDSGRKALQD